MITIEPPRSSEAVGSDLSRPALTRFLKRTREAVGLTGSVDVLLSDDATLRQLNRTWRGKNKPTDVLSFPAATNGSGQDIAGDLAISLDTAGRQAADHGHGLDEEVRILILHGLLHLAGYDHETDQGEMAAREAELRRELRLSEGLIARTTASTPKSSPAEFSRKLPAKRAARSTRRTAR